ncbi:MAG: NAD(P)/FAD-dependent oxidoreductase [Candidatus Woesearchaeota archaeon]
MITVVGAGPVGCFAAHLLASKGEKVQLFENHRSLGTPLQCTGLVTNSIKQVLPLDEDLILNDVSHARIFSPDKTCFDIDINDFVLDRSRFDRRLADLAVASGARLHLSHRFVSKSRTGILLDNNGKPRTVSTDLVVGSDGPLSKVAHVYQLFGKRRFWTGMQASVKLKNDNVIEFYPFLGTFAWVVPESRSIARIGVLSENNPRPLFDKFISERAPHCQVISRQAGLVPRYNPAIKVQNQERTVFLVGDAAAQVKATSAGGLVSGLTAASCLARSILGGKDYETLVRRELGSDLRLHLLARKILDRFSLVDYNRLVYLCSQPRVRTVFSKIDRDHPIRLTAQLVLREPRLLCFLRCLL